MHGVNKDLWASRLPGGVVGVLESVQGGVDDSGPLLLWGRVSPAMTGHRGRVEEEIDRRHVDFNKLLFYIGQVSLQTHRQEGTAYIHKHLVSSPSRQYSLNTHSEMHIHKHILTSSEREKPPGYTYCQHTLQVCIGISQIHTHWPSVLCSCWSQHPARHS